MTSRRPPAKSLYFCSASKLCHSWGIGTISSESGRADALEEVVAVPLREDLRDLLLPPVLGQHCDLVDPRIAAEELLDLNRKSIPPANAGGGLLGPTFRGVGAAPVFRTTSIGFSAN